MRNASSDEWKQTGNRTDDDEWRMMAKIEAPNIIRTVIIDSKKRVLIRAENQRSDLLLRQDGVGEKKKVLYEQKVRQRTQLCSCTRLTAVLYDTCIKYCCRRGTLMTK